ncbi:transpeptidase involved in peptidoglycan synthesis (penicillin-binding protein 2) [Crenothrix polyspora]|uniref:Peptidoglycan D,D-transpeptidase MrdA n=1 Tax=Crenothrix polyspora TaxID=360316 RepID=A0A1R4GYJ7_9GAMM|nr:penicillin-binding protein 2 [Crenothrix polyspora]SJM89038.1 transpeptidase involved in peptidoglycan synthesis (penicillin-binding protein 2) [Crenothrix polyspora]
MPSRSYPMRDKFLEERLFLNRIVAAFITIAVLTSGLIVRLIYLQIVGHIHYATLAKENSIKIIPLVPTRGMIYDRRGRVLAENTQTFKLEITPDKIGDTPGNLNETLLRLQKLLNIPDEKIEQFHKLRARQKRFAPTTLLTNMSNDEMVKFAVVRPYFPGVDIKTHLVRNYPFKELSAHVVGYVGRINEKELKSLPIAEYGGSTYIGKLGIESSYEAILHGKTGYAEMETNVQARALKTLNEVDPIAGANLYLTLDMDLQKTAYDALDKFNGAVVAIEIKTGGVLVFASRPGFDPNPFVSGIGSAEYKALTSSDDQPLYNRALRGLYPPGSTVKPFIALAGLEYEAISKQTRLHCPGFYQLPNDKHRFRDWKKTGHGSVGMNEAITQSCDVYFYRLANLLGIERMHNFMQRMGFGEKTGIDLIGEKAGIYPSKDWKLKEKKQRWYPGETLITGIGQGFTLVTPLQLARATATLANKGSVVTPFLVDKIVAAAATTKGPETHKDNLNLNASNVSSIFSAMVNVVHGAGGTAKSIGHGINYQIAGKTGTAQVFNIKQGAKYNERSIGFKLHDHALFISFAPADNPQIAVAVIAEHGGHGGSVAAPIAAKVIKQFLGGNGENRNPP